MKKLFFALAAVLFAACATDATEDVAIEAPETLKVSFEESTRIQLQNGKTVWTEGDLVSVFYKSYENMKWKFAGKTGDRTGTLLKVSGSANEQTMDNVVVAYPYSDYYSISLSTGGLVAFLPAEQTYMADSYGVDGNIMVSQSEYKQFVLKSVCGWVKIQLTGNGEKIQSIKLKGNNGEQVAGEIYINTADATTTLASAIYSNFDNTEVGGTMLEDNTILAEVTLNCGEGVTLGKNATAFYIALPPQEFSKGLTVEIEDTEGYVMEQSTDKVVTVERNHILPMAAFEFINPATPTTPTISANEIWYTAKEKVEPTFDDHFTFGANAVSNVWDSESKRGIITFDGDVTMIGDDAFKNCYKLTGVTLPEGVTSIGKKAFYYCIGLTEFTIPDSVTSIGEYAFYYCSSLTSITIGDSVTEIGDYAFRDCSSLTAFYGKFASADNRCLIIDGVLRFFARKGLTEYTIPDSVTSIGSEAFYDYDSLESVTIGDSVTSIGNWAFTDCNSLTSVTIGDSVTSIGSDAFRDCNSLESVTIGDSVIKIGENAFNGCRSLTSVTIPDSVTSIGERAFYSCDSLESVTIGNSVTSIGWYAFQGCTSLTSVTIPDSVTSIGGYAFSSCSSLISITFPERVTWIGNCAFQSCDSLTSITIPDSVIEIGERAFNYCRSLKKVYCYATIPPSLGDNAFNSNASARRIYVYEECVELYKSAWSDYKYGIYSNGKNCPDTTTIEYTTNDGNIITSSALPIISNSYENGVGTLVVGRIAKIPSSAFEYCRSLTSITIPNSVTSIGGSAFEYCRSLTSVTIPNSVIKIGGSAFSSCDSLTSITIPDGVTSIGSEAFRYCTSLKEVYCKPTTPPSGGYDMFSYYSNGYYIPIGCKIYVPRASVDAYKAAVYWRDYAADIEPYDFE